jgi:mono/diheme cytochrome c family protein
MSFAYPCRGARRARAPRPLLVALATLLPLAVASAGCGSAQTPTQASASAQARAWVPSTEKRAADGGQLYVTLGCVGCHSTDGTRGAGRSFRGLAGGDVTATSIARAIRRHRPALRTRPSDPQVRALAEFITMIGPTTAGATTP